MCKGDLEIGLDLFAVCSILIREGLHFESGQASSQMRRINAKDKTDHSGKGG